MVSISSLCGLASISYSCSAEHSWDRKSWCELVRYPATCRVCYPYTRVSALYACARARARVCVCLYVVFLFVFVYTCSMISSDGGCLQGTVEDLLASFTQLANQSIKVEDRLAFLRSAVMQFLIHIDPYSLAATRTEIAYTIITDARISLTAVRSVTARSLLLLLRKLSAIC